MEEFALFIHRAVVVTFARSFESREVEPRMTSQLAELERLIYDQGLWALQNKKTHDLMVCDL